MSGAADNWYYLDGTTMIGPLSESHIQRLIDQGLAPSTVRVAQAGWPRWLPASEAFTGSNAVDRLLPPPPGAPSDGSGIPAGPGHRHQTADVLESLRRRLQTLAGTEDLQGFSLSDMFSQVFRHRTDEELDDYFIVGTYRTTPPLEQIDVGWPRPWFFARVLLFVGAVYLGFSFATTEFHNANLIPGLIMMGSLAVPLATVFLFFELNTPRNVPLPRILTLFCAGGIASLIVSLVGYDVFSLGWLGDMQAGIIEEIGKLIAVVLLVRNVRYKYLLNGMLFGAAVGAGFAAFESAGYAFRTLLASSSVDNMTSLIRLRAFLTPFGHIAWTAIAAGALWRVKREKPFNPKMLFDRRFLRTISIPIVLHMIWDSPLPSPFFAVQIGAGVIGWYVVFGLVQEGLHQVKTEQLEVLKERLDRASRLVLGSPGGPAGDPVDARPSNASPPSGDARQAAS